MKKHLLMLCAAVIAATMSLEARVILIDDGFENGIQDSVWTQEYVAGDMPWSVEDVEDGISYPATVFQGSKRAFLRNPTNETMGYVTRLVSKVMDLNPFDVKDPELIFWYANPKWGADCDTLRVLYRTGTRAAWKTMAEFGTASSDWQRVKLVLPEVGRTYQIAFEGKDNLGHGILLDSVKLQSAPDCTIPNRISVSNKGAGKVNIAWKGSWDVDEYEMIVCKDTIDPDMVEELEQTMPEKIAFHGLVGDATNYDLILESGEFYLVYIRSICDGGEEISVWSSEGSKDGPFGFRVRVAKQIPFTENFNYPSSQKRDPDWNWGSNTGKTNPFVNSATTGKARANYSPDTTAAVIFSGGAFDELTTVLPADRYAYVATPALSDTTKEDFAVNQCQVHFWSTVYTNTGRKFGRSIIVGVMTDPDDITTFVPVDTVSVWGNKSFVESIVDLGSYQGEGVFLAFVSDFDRDNLFYIDNVTVEYRKQVNKVTGITVNPRDTYATISWEGNASSYDVLVTNGEVDPENPSADAVVDQATVSGNSYLCEALEADHSWNRPYYVYVKAQGTEWSYRYPFVTIAAQRAIPYSYDFEASTSKYQIAATGTKQYATGIGIFGNSGSYPAVEVSSAKSYVGSGCLSMSMMGGKDGWLTLPMVEHLDSVQIKFYLSGYTTYDQAHATVGVMTNPMDINTFVPVADFQLNTTGYTRCYANFENYSGPKDGVIAIVWADVQNMSKFTNNYIDELVVEELSDCVPPTNIELDIMPDSITVKWDASALANEWELIVSRVALKEADRAHKTLAELLTLPGVVVGKTLTWSDAQTAPQFGIGELTPHSSYYMYVRATCDREWWSEAAFATPCRDEEFPFKETFESYNSGGTAAGCWELADYLGVDYPVVYQAGSSSSGNKTLELYSSGTTHRSVAIAPTVEGELSGMLLSLEVRTRESSASATGMLIVGTMSDIEDQSSFVPFDTVYVKGGSFQKARFILSNYELAYDRIAFTSGLGSLKMNSDVLIDNVEFKDPSCIDAFDFKQTNFAPHTVDLSWNGISANDEWIVKVLSRNVAVAAVKNNTYDHSCDVVTDSLVTGKSVQFTGLQAMRNYYVYVRALCGDSAWASTSVYTTCELLDPSKPNKETFESGTGLDCWTLGITSATGTTPYVTSVGSGDNARQVLHIRQSSSTGWAASPEIKCDSITSLLVSFSLSAYSSEYGVYGVMTDPNDLSTFVAIDSMRGTGSSNFQNFSIDLTEYAGLIPATAKYFAWRGRYNTSDWVYIDDVSFVSMACPLTKPGISELTTSSVRVSSGLRTDDQWILLVTNRMVSDERLADESYVIPEDWIVYRDTVDKRSREIFNLSGQTKYYVATATLCEDSVMSQWSTFSFTTLCEARTPDDLGTVTFSEEEGFEDDEMPCWTVGSKTQNVPDTYIPYVEGSSSTAHGGKNYLRLYDYVSSSYTYVGAYAIMPELDVDSIHKYQVNFWGRSYNSSSYNNQVIVGIITDPSDLLTFVPIDTLNLSKTTWDPFSVGFEHYESDYMGDMGRHIMFLSDFGVTNYAYISEISVEPIPTCRSISSFTVDSVGEDAAVISWKGYQDTYRLMVADKALTDDQKLKYRYLVDTIVDHSDAVLLPNLNPTTNYYVYAQGICDGGDSTAISMTYAAFRTECPTQTGAPLPFYDDFESYHANDQAFGCWQVADYNGSGYPKILNLTSGAQSGLQLELWSTSTSHRNVVMMPLIDGDLADCQLSFDTRSWSTSAASILYVGTMADITDQTTFVPFETINNTGGTTFNHVTLNLADYDLMYDYLAFSSGLGSITTGSDVMIDNIALERIATCSAPKMKTRGVTYNSAELVLTPVQKTDSHFELVVITDLEYSLIGDIAQYLETAKKISLDTTYIKLTGLEQASSYYVFARTICSEEDRSSWSRNPLKISTQFYYESDYHFGFEKVGEQWQRSMYSVSDNYYMHPALVTGNAGPEATEAMEYYPHSRENTENELYSRVDVGAMLMHSDGGIYGGYVIFPSIGVPKARSFEFKVRPGVLDATTKLAQASFNGVFEIGTVDKDGTFDSYEQLAAVRMDKLNPATKATSKNNMLFSNYTLDLDSATMADKQLVLYLPKQSSDSVNLFFDEVVLGAPRGYSLVSLKKVLAEGTTALVEWQNIGGPWNLYITDAAGRTIAQYLNLNGVTSQQVENLEPNTPYIARLEAADAPAEAKSYVTSDKLVFRTHCEALEPDDRSHGFVWNFDSADEWEANDVLGGDSYDSLYYKPACFNVGLTYNHPVNGYQWLVQRKGYEAVAGMTEYNASRHYEAGLNDSHALRVHTTPAAYNSYLVLPKLECGLDTMMIEFYGRCFVNYDQTYGTSSNRGRIVDATYLGSAYSQSLVVGTLTDPMDLNTLHIIDTLTYSHTDLTVNTNVSSDPAGLRYWEQMQLPLDSAKGDYIVLFQPAPGLFYLDGLSVKPVGNTLFKPMNPQTTQVTATTATLQWNVRRPRLQSVVVLYDGQGVEIFRDTVTGTTCQLTDLTAAKMYEWCVYQTDGSNDSPATRHIGFTTDCVTNTPDYTCGFEPEEGWKFIDGQSTYKQTICWTYGDAANNEWLSGTYDPTNQANTRDNSYSFSGTNALAMRASFSSRGISYQPYVAMPAMDITAYDTLQVMFWMRPALVSATNDSVISSYTGSSYSKSIIVGTMTDPDNAATFVPIDTVTYDGTLSVADKATAANNFLFQQMKVELEGATGPYVAFMTSAAQKGSTVQKTGDYIWLDDISFERRQECKDPKELTALQVGAYHALLQWHGADSAGSYLLQVSTDPYFADEEAYVFNERVESSTYRVEGLEPQQTYVWRVQAICGERWGESSFSQKATFKTSRSPYYLEEFEAALNANEWTFSKAHANNVVDGTGALAHGLDAWSFTRTTNGYGLPGSHYASVGYSGDYHWLVSPVFFLPDEDSVHFSMDLALTACNTAHAATNNAVTDNDMKDDYYFMIIVSDDGGQSWKSENILAKWQNTNPEGMQLRDIPSDGMKVRYSLAHYAGKNVRIGLYREAKTTSNTGIAVHVDNFRLAYFDKMVDYASACQYEDVTIGDIHLSGDDTKPGLHAYPTCYYMTDDEARAGQRDSVRSLEIEVFPTLETAIQDTICEGESYTRYDFMPKEKGGVYRRKLQTLEHGCDSIVTLYLCVKERRYGEETEVTICKGEPYEWHGKTYNRAGIYRDTLVSSIGCDSVETLIISYVSDASVDTIYEQSRVELNELPFTYENALWPYAAGQAPITYPMGTPKGEYKDTVRVQGTSCSAILVHTLTVYDRQEAIENVTDTERSARKVIVRDRMYIVLDDEWYSVTGQKVDDPR